ncbi:TetR/AcrR family transcriptional regulator C-terminal domain-containing protein [Streptomyces lienomycini]
MSGELAPGDRVPSTRLITREWGVATATATKALAVLGQEGLVRAVPGVGTLVADPAAGRRTATGGALSRESVVAAAIALADSEGIGALSMRRVATELGTSTMALYRHVPSRAELLRLMSEEVFGGQPSGPRPPGWRDRLAREARWLWSLYERHPWLSHTMASLTRPMAAANAMRYSERVLSSLSGLGLTPHQMMRAHLMIIGYAQGLAGAIELESQARQDTGVTADEWFAGTAPRLEAIHTTGAYPVMSTLFEHDQFDPEPAALFEFGLERMLGGLDVLVAQAARAAGEAPGPG